MPNAREMYGGAVEAAAPGRKACGPPPQ